MAFTSLMAIIVPEHPPTAVASPMARNVWASAYDWPMCTPSTEIQRSTFNWYLPFNWYLHGRGHDLRHVPPRSPVANPLPARDLDSLRAMNVWRRTCDSIATASYIS